MVTNFNTVFFTLTFLFPGFIIFYIKSMLVPQRVVHPSNYIFRYFFYSSINVIITVPTMYYIKTNNLHTKYPYLVIFIWLVTVIVLPIILGIVMGNLSAREIDKKILLKVCPATIGSIPTAWDYKFSKLTEGRFVIIKLKDNSLIGGVYSTKSYASSQQEERDIYLEEMYTMDEDENWIKIESGDGVLVKGSEIVAIEFKHINYNNESKQIEELNTKIDKTIQLLEELIEQKGGKNG